MSSKRETNILKTIGWTIVTSNFSLINYFSRCPDPQKPSAVLYDQETDRLVPFSDTYESVETDCGPVSISGIVKKFSVKGLKSYL